MLVRPHHFEYKRTSDLHQEKLTADERASLDEAGLDKPWAVCGHGDGAVHEPPRNCFYCSHKLTIPAVMWHGYTEPIWMHPVCAEKLCHRLMRDVRELRKGKTYADQVLRQRKAKERTSPGDQPS